MKVQIEMPDGSQCVSDDMICPCLHDEGEVCQLLGVSLAHGENLQVVKDVDCPAKEKKPLCKLGRCETKNSHYQGGDDTVFNKLKNGICPICGGPAESI